MRIDAGIFGFMHRKTLQAIARCEGRQAYAWAFLLAHYAVRCEVENGQAAAVDAVLALLGERGRQ